MIGQIVPSIRTTIPDGYIECNGQTITRQDYPKFFEWLSITADTYTLPALNTSYTTLGHAGTSSFSFRTHENGANDTIGNATIQRHDHGSVRLLYSQPNNSYVNQGTTPPTSGPGYYYGSGTIHAVLFARAKGISSNRDDGMYVKYLIGVE